MYDYLAIRNFSSILITELCFLKRSLFYGHRCLFFIYYTFTECNMYLQHNTAPVLSQEYVAVTKFTEPWYFQVNLSFQILLRPFLSFLLPSSPFLLFISLLLENLHRVTVSRGSSPRAVFSALTRATYVCAHCVCVIVCMWRHWDGLIPRQNTPTEGL
jgi:hypothetical protein